MSSMRFILTLISYFLDAFGMVHEVYCACVHGHLPEPVCMALQEAAISLGYDEVPDEFVCDATRGILDDLGIIMTC